jgi:hypothetical protein
MPTPLWGRLHVGGKTFAAAPDD